MSFCTRAVHSAVTQAKQDQEGALREHRGEAAGNFSKGPFIPAVRTLHANMACFLQEARDDLQKRLKAEEPEPEQKEKACKDRSPSRGSKGNASKKRKHPSAEHDAPKPLKDEAEDSWQADASEDDAEAGSEGPKSSHSQLGEDDDIFKDRFQQKRHEKSETKESGNRFQRLPADLKKILGDFEEKVLESLPPALLQSLSY